MHRERSLHRYLSIHFSRLLAPLNSLSLLIISGLLLIVFVVDILLSLIAISNIKGVFKGGTVDLTAEIKRFSINYYKKPQD